MSPPRTLDGIVHAVERVVDAVTHALSPGPTGPELAHVARSKKNEKTKTQKKTKSQKHPRKPKHPQACQVEDAKPAKPAKKPKRKLKKAKAAKKDSALERFDATRAPRPKKRKPKPKPASHVVPCPPSTPKPGAPTPPVSTTNTGGGGTPPPSSPLPVPPVYAPRGSVGGDTGWLNVMSYGAVGDGVADDTAALNAACNAARAVNVDGGAAVVYLPTGVYKVSGPINVFDVFLRGDGMGASRIHAPVDWAAGGAPNSSWVLDQQPSTSGVGAPAQDAADVGPAPLPGTWIEDLWVSGPGQIKLGSIPCNLSGVRVGTGAGYSRMRVDGFFAGAFLFSSEEKILGPGKQGGNYYGIYCGEPSPSAGGQHITDIEIDGCAWASIGISSSNALQIATFHSLLLGSAPFGIYKEEAPTGGVALSSCMLSNVHFDSCGNGNIFVNGPSGGGGDIAECLFQGTQSSNVFDPSTAVAVSTSDARGRAIGRTLAPIDLLDGNWMSNEVQASDPAYIGANNSNYSTIVACGKYSAGRYAPAQTAITQVVADGKRFTTGTCDGDSLVMNVGTACRLMPAARNGILTSDLVEAPSGSQAGAQRSTGTRRTLGVAIHPANSGDSVPVAYSGVVIVNCGTNSISPDDPLKADPTQVGCVITANLTDPGLVGVAQQASSNGTVQAILQSL